MKEVPLDQGGTEVGELHEQGFERACGRRDKCALPEGKHQGVPVGGRFAQGDGNLPRTPALQLPASAHGPDAPPLPLGAEKPALDEPLQPPPEGFPVPHGRGEVERGPNGSGAMHRAYRVDPLPPSQRPGFPSRTPEVAEEGREGKAPQGAQGGDVETL